jgi:hypothetical protein
MHRLRPLLLLLALSGCAPASLPRLQLAVAHGDRTGAGSGAREQVVWLRLVWGGRARSR